MLCLINGANANANVAEDLAPHYGPSSTSHHHSDSNQGRSTMSAKKESYHDSVQIVKDAIKVELINNVITKLQANVTGPTEDIATRLDWTSACDDLLQFYRTEVHPKVSLRDRYIRLACCWHQLKRYLRIQISLHLSSHLRRQHWPSRWSNELTQAPTNIPFAVYDSLLIIIPLFLLSLLVYPQALMYEILMNVEKYRGRRVRLSTWRGVQILFVRRKGEGSTSWWEESIR